MKPENFYEREPKPHIFSPEGESMALQILESLQTAKEAAEFLLRVQEQADGQFMEMAELLKVMLGTIQQSAVPYREKLSVIKLPLACQCMKQSLDIVRNLQKKDDQRRRHIMNKNSRSSAPILILISLKKQDSTNTTFLL